MQEVATFAAELQAVFPSEIQAMVETKAQREESELHAAITVMRGNVQRWVRAYFWQGTKAGDQITLGHQDLRPDGLPDGIYHVSVSCRNFNVTFATGNTFVTRVNKVVAEGDVE